MLRISNEGSALQKSYSLADSAVSTLTKDDSIGSLDTAAVNHRHQDDNDSCHLNELVGLPAARPGRAGPELD